MQIKRSFIEWIAQQFGGRCACTIGQDAIVHLFIFGAITFFLRARHPALVIEWVIVFCLFVCSFRNSQEYLRQMLLVFFFLPFMLICLMQIQCQLMIGDSHWLGSSLPHSLCHESTSECKRKTIFFLHYLVSIDTARPHSEFDMTPKTKYYRKVCFLLSLVETNKFQQQKHIKSTLIYNLNWQTLNVKRTIYISNVTMNERENLKIF